MKVDSELTGEVLIRAEGLSKKFCRSLKRSMYYGLKDSLYTMFGINYRQDILRKSEFWALRDINFELKKGETLGIIGINGAGKSTLLRLLTGIFPPDEGRIEIKGRIGSLIAVGVGFHPHMSGRENIYLNGTLLGMSRKEITAKFDEIVDFAEILEALDAPVATYSSGMKVRLGFSIAIHCDPDIMLIDEVLSVGDIGFKNKSLRKLHEYKEKANGVIFISHDLEQIRTLCDRLIVLDRGKILFKGSTHDGIVYYENRVRDERLKNIKDVALRNNLIEEHSSYQFRESSGDVLEFLDIGILNRDSVPSREIYQDEPLNYYCNFKVLKPVKSLYFSVGVLDEKYRPVIWVMSNDNDKERFENIQPGNYRLIVQFPEHHLIPSIYIPNVAIRNGETGETYERAWTKASFHIKSTGEHLNRGIIAVKENWILMPETLNSENADVFEDLKEGDVVIDCGANKGDVTEPMAQKGATVYAFEPNPHVFSELKNRFADSENVICYNKGVWDKNGKMPLYLHLKSDEDPVKYSVSSSILENKRNIDKENFIDIELVDLHEFIIGLKKQISILKLDVEGVEVEILNKLIDKGSINLIDKVLVETHEKQMPELFEPMVKLRKKIADAGLENINLNWM